MKVTSEVLEFIKSKEGLRLAAYLCPAGLWTIGYGNTFYENGLKVKRGDKIDKERAEQLFENIINIFASDVRKLINTTLTDNQFSALVSFAYNVGIGNLSKSTLLKKINENPKDITIRDEFVRWNKGGGKVLRGLTIRRKYESDIYFKI